MTAECDPGYGWDGSECVLLTPPDDPLDAWVQTAGPPCGADYRIEIDPNDGTIYAGAFGGGLFKSTDGRTWRLTGVFQERYYWVNDIEIDRHAADTLYVVGSDRPGTHGLVGTIYKTSDGAESWTELTGATSVDRLAVSPVVAGSLIASDREGNVHISGDGGVTWSSHAITLPEPIPDPPPEVPIFDVAAGDAHEFWVAPASGSGKLLHTCRSTIPRPA